MVSLGNPVNPWHPVGTHLENLDSTDSGTGFTAQLPANLQHRSAPTHQSPRDTRNHADFAIDLTTQTNVRFLSSSVTNDA